MAPMARILLAQKAALARARLLLFFAAKAADEVLHT
jgi:hypothetical protein